MITRVPLCNYCGKKPSTGRYWICGEWAYHCDDCKPEADAEMKAYETAQATELVNGSRK